MNIKATEREMFLASFKLYRWYKGGKWIKVGHTYAASYWVNRETFGLIYEKVLKTEDYNRKMIKKED